MLNDFINIQEKLNKSREAKYEDPTLHALLTFYTEQIYLKQHDKPLAIEILTLYDYITKNYVRRRENENL